MARGYHEGAHCCVHAGCKRGRESRARVAGETRFSQNGCVQRSSVLWSPLLFLLLAGALSIGCADRETSADAPPNIVLIVVDTLRRDHVSAYGADIATPTMQGLADAGQVFTQLQASYHQTTMSMAALFTGRTPSIESGVVAEPLGWEGRHWCGMVRFAAGPEDSCVPQGLTTLAESLRDAGYWTAGVVANRLLFAPAGYDQGFDAWAEVGAERADLPRQVLVAARAAPLVNGALEKVLGDRPPGPAFVYVHYLDVHDYQTKLESYAEAVERFDVELSKALAILADAGLRGERTVLFLISDHGENLGELHWKGPVNHHFGNPSFQPLLDIPLIVSPAVFDEPSRLLRTRDVPGLVRSVAGLRPELADESELFAPDELFLSERDYITYRRGRYKAAFHRRKMGKWQLYDLETDPGETDNRIGEDREVGLEYLARVQELTAKLAAEDRGEGEISEEDASRLRALGYLE